MANKDSFYQKKCDKIDAADVDAYIDLSLDPDNPTGVVLDHSWGTQKIDLESIVKAGETVTHMMLDPMPVPEYLRYDPENGESDCIHGDDLSRIISLRYLKDVDQGTRPVNGDVYMYNSEDGKFYTFNLQQYMDDTDAHLRQLDNQITVINQTIGQIQTALTQLTQRVATIEDKIAPPANAPSDARIVHGNINVYGDVNDGGSHSNGLYSHDPNNDVTNDQYFS